MHTDSFMHQSKKDALSEADEVDEEAEALDDTTPNAFVPTGCRATVPSSIELPASE